MPISTDPLPITPSTAIEEDQESEVMKTTDKTDIQDSPHQFPGTINTHAGQTFILTLTQIDCTTKLATIIGIDIICIPHLITHIICPITLLIILVICNVI